MIINFRLGPAWTIDSYHHYITSENQESPLLQRHKNNFAGNSSLPWEGSNGGHALSQFALMDPDLESAKQFRRLAHLHIHGGSNPGTTETPDHSSRKDPMGLASFAPLDEGSCRFCRRSKHNPGAFHLGRKRNQSRFLPGMRTPTQPRMAGGTHGPKPSCSVSAENRPECRQS